MDVLYRLSLTSLYLVSEQGQSVEDDPEQDVDGGEGLSEQPAVAS